ATPRPTCCSAATSSAPAPATSSPRPRSRSRWARPSRTSPSPSTRTPRSPRRSWRPRSTRTGARYTSRTEGDDSVPGPGPAGPGPRAERVGTVALADAGPAERAGASRDVPPRPGRLRRVVGVDPHVLGAEVAAPRLGGGGAGGEVRLQQHLLLAEEPRDLGRVEGQGGAAVELDPLHRDAHVRQVAHGAGAADGG